MRTTQLRQADLNLLVIFAVLAEERNVSAAAERLFLSQPAVSRALQRLQILFKDQLLFRVKGGYDLTAHGKRLLSELETTLPRLDALIRGAAFDPVAEAATFRVGVSDYACNLLGPKLINRMLTKSSKASLLLTPWSETIHQDLEHGRLDVLLNADDGLIPPHLITEPLFDEELVCVVAQDSRWHEKMSLRDYERAEHIIVSLLVAQQTVVDQPLGQSGFKRKSRLSVPYFSAAIGAAACTEMVATVPKRFARLYAQHSAIRFVSPPKELASYRYLMVWHPRVDTDAASLWLREQVRLTAVEFSKS